MSPKFIVICLAALLSVHITNGGRIGPVEHIKASTKAVDRGNNVDKVEGCEEDDCLVERLLAAHVDYIYTQETP
uniref:Phytosulfokine n=1 Tax=Leersia perrieri TaxID=77586 RepID=A0A0D9VXC6_9ORYZ